MWSLRSAECTVDEGQMFFQPITVTQASSRKFNKSSEPPLCVIRLLANPFITNEIMQDGTLMRARVSLFIRSTFVAPVDRLIKGGNSNGSHIRTRRATYTFIVIHPFRL